MPVEIIGEAWTPDAQPVNGSKRFASHDQNLRKVWEEPLRRRNWYSSG